MKSKFKKQNILYIVIIVASALIIVLLFCYIKPYSKYQWDVLAKFNLPIGHAGGKVIKASQFQNFLLTQPGASPKTKTQYSEALKIFASDTASSIVFSDKQLPVSPNELSELLIQKAKVVKDGGWKPAGLSPIVSSSDGISLKNSNWSANTLALSLWYMNQESLHPNQSTAAKAKLEELNDADKEGFDLYSVDTGFIKSNELTPELELQIKRMNPGESKIIPSRFGLHAIRLVEKREDAVNKQTLVRLYNSLVTIDGFDSWLQRELESVKVYYYFAQ